MCRPSFYDQATTKFSKSKSINVDYINYTLLVPESSQLFTINFKLCKLILSRAQNKKQKVNVIFLTCFANEGATYTNKKETHILIFFFKIFGSFARRVLLLLSGYYIYYTTIYYIYYITIYTIIYYIYYIYTIYTIVLLYNSTAN